MDPNDPLHAKHQEDFKKARLNLSRLAPMIMEKPDVSLYPSMGNGFIMGGDGDELSSEEHKAILEKTKSIRRYYERVVFDRGKPRIRKTPTKPLHQIPITFKPAIALAISRLDRVRTDGTRKIDSKEVLKKWAPKIAREFAAATGYEVIAIQVHAGEGCLHFHLTYASVSAKHELLNPRYRRERHGIRLLGIALIAAFRLNDDNLLPSDKLAEANRFLEDRKTSGNLVDDPIDLRLSRMLDSMCYHFASQDPEIHAAFAEAQVDYERTFGTEETLTRIDLVEHAKAQGAKLAEYKSVVETQRGQLEQMSRDAEAGKKSADDRVGVLNQKVGALKSELEQRAKQHENEIAQLRAQLTAKSLRASSQDIPAPQAKPTAAPVAYFVDGKMGSFSAAQIRDGIRIGKIVGNTSVWSSLQPEFQPLDKLEEFAEALQASRKYHGWFADRDQHKATPPAPARPPLPEGYLVRGEARPASAAQITAQINSGHLNRASSIYCYRREKFLPLEKMDEFGDALKRAEKQTAGPVARQGASAPLPSQTQQSSSPPAQSPPKSAPPALPPPSRPRSAQPPQPDLLW